MAPVPTIAEVDDGAEVSVEVEDPSPVVVVCAVSVPAEVVELDTVVVVASPVPDVVSLGVAVGAADGGTREEVGSRIGAEVVDAAAPKALVTLLGAEPAVRLVSGSYVLSLDVASVEETAERTVERPTIIPLSDGVEALPAAVVVGSVVVGSVVVGSVVVGSVVVGGGISAAILAVVDGFDVGWTITDGNNPVEPPDPGVPAGSVFVAAAAAVESDVLVGASAGESSAIGALLAAVLTGGTTTSGTPAVDPTAWDVGAEPSLLDGDVAASGSGELDGLLG